jgi:4-hydroxyphenylpyruvate dioxygenase
MRRAISTISLSGTLEEKLESAAAAGFDAVQIVESDILYYGDTPASVRAMAAELGLAIDAYQPLRDFEGLDAAGLAKGLDRAGRIFDTAQALGAPLVLVPATTLQVSSPDPAVIADHLRKLAESAGSRSIQLAYGALDWAAHVRTLADAWAIVQRVGHPGLDIFLSSFQLLALNGGKAELTGIPGNRIASVQVADVPNVTIDSLSKNRFYSCFPGEGDLDLTSFVKALLATDYAGGLTLEVFNDAFRGAPSRTIAEDGMRSLLLLEENTRHAVSKLRFSQHRQAPQQECFPVPLRQGQPGAKRGAGLLRAFLLFDARPFGLRDWCARG